MTMALVRWDPIHDLAGYEIDRLNRMFSDLYNESVSRAWVPPVDIYEADHREVVIKAELPDMQREQISVTFENNVLTLKGERAETEVGEGRFRRVERRAGTFSRSFTLPYTADPSGITASYKDGVLTVRIPQREEAKPKQIAVE
jgi:HSP20 family protein